MAITLVSGNLNQYGNAGQFETDRSTWGFADWAGLPSASNTYMVTRSSVEKTAGLYSALVSKPSLSDLLIIPSRFTREAGKTYLLRCNIKIPSSEPIVSDGDITLNSSGSNILFGCTVLENNPVPFGDAIDTWQEVSVKLECVNDTFPDLIAYLNYTGTAILNGKIYVDQFEIYEYIETVDPDPDPSCDVDLDPDATTVVNETSEAAGDGSIDLSASGTPTLEFSKDGSTWQLASLFAGLVTDIYIIRVRKQDLTSCLKEYPFAVNFDAVTHDFTALITHESVAGLHDGAISLSVTGTGGPYEYSIDAGVTWQISNNFTGVAPGLYYVAVRNAVGNSVVKLATVTAGTVEFDTIFHSKNPIIFPKAASSGWELLTNYRVYNDVRVEDVADSGNYNSKLKVELQPDTDGQVIFYIREAFRGVFTFTPPTQNHSSIIRLTDRIKRFRNYSGELTGTEITPEELTPSASNLVLFGGIDKFHYPGLNYFTSYLPANKKFLTWAPLVKTVDRLQEDYLNFFVYDNFNSLKLRLKVYFDDSTDETAISFTKTGTSISELYQIPAGPANSGAMLVNPAKNAISYELSLLDHTDAVISEVRTYIISRVKHPLTRYFMFLNSLGAFEVLRFTGQAMVKTSFNRDIVQRFLAHNYNALDGEFAVHNVSRQKQLSYSSGYVKEKYPKQWHEYLEDFMGSSIVYDVTSGQRSPITILSGDHNMEDQNYERYIRIDAKPSYDNESFTPLSI